MLSASRTHASCRLLPAACAAQSAPVVQPTVFVCFLVVMLVVSQKIVLSAFLSRET